MAIVFDTETTGLISPTMILDDQPFMIEIFALKIDDRFVRVFLWRAHRRRP
jgi:hypothetical protein